VYFLRIDQLTQRIMFGYNVRCCLDHNIRFLPYLGP
jgi:hypothetical protein